MTYMYVTRAGTVWVCWLDFSIIDIQIIDQIGFPIEIITTIRATYRLKWSDVIVICCHLIYVPCIMLAITGTYRNARITSLSSPFLYFSRYWDRPLKDFRHISKCDSQSWITQWAKGAAAQGPQSQDKRKLSHRIWSPSRDAVLHVCAMHGYCRLSSQCSFYPRGASSARVIAIIVCLCVCVCVSVCHTPVLYQNG